VLLSTKAQYLRNEEVRVEYEEGGGMGDRCGRNKK
jgi:hypothetical protein